MQAQTCNGGRRARKRGSDRTIADLPPSPPILARTRKDSTPTDSDDHELEALHHTMAAAPEVADDDMPQPKTRRSDTADMDIQEDEPVRLYLYISPYG
jgi:hypothetical protein